MLSCETTSWGHAIMSRRGWSARQLYFAAQTDFLTDSIGHLAMGNLSVRTRRLVRQRDYEMLGYE